MRLPVRRLEQRLRDARYGLTIVVAPAGWGKTSLLSSWAAHPGDGVRVAWVSLDDTDDEPTRFWRYALTALRGASDDISAGCLDALRVSGAAPVDLALPILLNELAESSTPHVLVLDDYHVLTDRRIHESVEFLVSYLPASLRLVVAGRFDPPLPIAGCGPGAPSTNFARRDLRAVPRRIGRVGVSGLRSRCRRFRRHRGVGANRRLGGRPAIGRARDAGRPPFADRAVKWWSGQRFPGDGFRADNRHLLDYFTAEVLPAVTPAQRDLLVRAAPLERLCGSLCDEALQVTGSAEVLSALDRADLFLVALDAEHEWFRCHHLFRDVLLREPEARSGTATNDVLRRAAGWFERHDRVDEAVRLLIRAGDPAAATALLGSSQQWFMERGATATNLMLGEMLPKESSNPNWRP